MPPRRWRRWTSPALLKWLIAPLSATPPRRITRRCPARGTSFLPQHLFASTMLPGRCRFACALGEIHNPYNWEEAAQPVWPAAIPKFCQGASHVRTAACWRRKFRECLPPATISATVGIETEVHVMVRVIGKNSRRRGDNLVAQWGGHSSTDLCTVPELCQNPGCFQFGQLLF